VIIADTNIVSELMRQAPDASVLSWVQGLPTQELTICVITAEEIERRLGKTPHGARPEDPRRRWDRPIKISRTSRNLVR